MAQEDPKADGKMTQEELEKLHKEIEANANYANELKKEQEQWPFISEQMESKVVAKEFENSKFADSFVMLMLDKEAGGRGYQHVRRLRRDGNCFYRSFLFQLFEHYGLVMAGEKADPDGKYKAKYYELIKLVEGSKKDMCDNAGYDEIVIEDFYDVFLEELKKLEGIKQTYEEAQKIAGE